MENAIPNLVVSLTSYPARIDTVYKTLNTLFQQSIKPERIVICLAKDEFKHLENDLPKSLLDYKNKGLEILWCENIGSYKKLIPTLRKYPDKIIVTADDDLLYKSNWLELLYKEYSKHKKYICSHRSHLILFDKKGNISKYDTWIKGFTHKFPSFKMFGTSGAGMLFPPRCFDKEILNKSAFMKLCPTADDIWINFMAIYSNIKVINLGLNGHRDIYCIENTQNNNLTEINVKKHMNDLQINNVLAEYPTIKKKLFLKNECKYNLYIFLSKIHRFIRNFGGADGS